MHQEALVIVYRSSMAERNPSFHFYERNHRKSQFPMKEIIATQAEPWTLYTPSRGPYVARS